MDGWLDAIKWHVSPENASGHNQNPNPGPTSEECMRTHPGFTITCDACGSGRAIVGNDLGFSETSGAWGGVWLECLGCGADCALVEP